MLGLSPDEKKAKYVSVLKSLVSEMNRLDNADKEPGSSELDPGEQKVDKQDLRSADIDSSFPDKRAVGDLDEEKEDLVAAPDKDDLSDSQDYDSLSDEEIKDALKSKNAIPKKEGMIAISMAVRPKMGGKLASKGRPRKK